MRLREATRKPKVLLDRFGDGDCADVAVGLPGLPAGLLGGLVCQKIHISSFDSHGSCVVIAREPVMMVSRLRYQHRGMIKGKRILKLLGCQM